MKATLVCEFFVPGEPQTAGSKTSFVPINKKTGQPFRDAGGRVIVNTVDSNPKGKSWRAVVADFARVSFGAQPLLDSPIALEVDFCLARPVGHLSSKGAKVKVSAPSMPDRRPDATKLLRCLEDGLTGVLWTDDARITLQVARKVYAEDGRVGARVRVWRLPATVAEGGVELQTDAAEVLVQGGLFT